MSYVGIGTSDPNHPLEVEGQVFISNVEQGSTTNLVPFEVHSDYTGITGNILEGARQMRFRVTPQLTTTSNVNMDMGIEPTSGSYFFISNPVVDTALGSNTAFRIVQAGHVEVGSNLSVSGNVVASNIVGGSPLTLSSDSLVKVAGSGGLSVTGPLNVDGTISQTGAVSGTSATYTGQVKAGTVSSTGVINGASATVTGQVQGATISSTGVINGASATVTGQVRGATISSTGDVIATAYVQGGTISSTGSLTGVSATVSGQVRGGTVSSTGDILATGTVTSSTLFRHSTGAVNNSGLLNESPGLTTDHYIYTRAIVNENQVGNNPSAIVFGNGSTYADDQISMITAGSTRLYINSSGNVGIGVASPSYRVHTDGLYYAAASQGGIKDVFYGINTNRNYNSGSLIRLGFGNGPSDEPWLTDLIGTGNGAGNYFKVEMGRGPGETQNVKDSAFYNRNNGGTIYSYFYGTLDAANYMNGGMYFVKCAFPYVNNTYTLPVAKRFAGIVSVKGTYDTYPSSVFSVAGNKDTGGYYAISTISQANWHYGNVHWTLVQSSGNLVLALNNGGSWEASVSMIGSSV